VAFWQKLDAAIVVNGDQADPRQSFRAHLEGNQAWLDAQPEGRFTFVFTPKHGS